MRKRKHNEITKTILPTQYASFLDHEPTTILHTVYDSREQLRGREVEI